MKKDEFYATMGKLFKEYKDCGVSPRRTTEYLYIGMAILFGGNTVIHVFEKVVNECRVH